MSIMQGYKEIKKRVGSAEWELMMKFLKAYPQYFLSDLLYNKKVYSKFEKWKQKYFKEA